MNLSKRVLIICGEASGDQQGAALVKAVHQMNPKVQFVGMGGPKMRAAGVEIKVDAGPLAVVGVTEIISHCVPIYKAWRTLTQLISQQPPDLLVLIDYPTFNLLLAKVAKQAGIKVLYYISPQVWAWHKSRIPKIGKRIDKMLVIFPFEVPLYQEKGIPVEYVGHPLLNQVHPSKSPQTMREEWGIPPKARIIGLLPGSRQKEIHRLLPVMLTAATQLKEKHTDLVFVLPLSDTLSTADIQPFLTAVSIPILIIPNQFYNTVQLCEAAIVTSGTATLETALLSIPMVIVYKTSLITYLLAKKFLKIPYIGLCNIVAGKQIVSELIQDQANPINIVTEINRILMDKNYQQMMQANLETVKIKLAYQTPEYTTESGAPKAASALMELLEK